MYPAVYLSVVYRGQHEDGGGGEEERGGGLEAGLGVLRGLHQRPGQRRPQQRRPALQRVMGSRD